MASIIQIYKVSQCHFSDTKPKEDEESSYGIGEKSTNYFQEKYSLAFAA
jgi:hypothetical protein